MQWPLSFFVILRNIELFMSPGIVATLYAWLQKLASNLVVVLSNVNLTISRKMGSSQIYCRCSAINQALILSNISIILCTTNFQMYEVHFGPPYGVLSF